MDKSFQDMILKYNKSKGRQIGAFNLKVVLPQSKFELGLFLFDFSLSLRDVLVDNVMGQLERWYFRSLRPEAEVDMKIIDAFGCVLRYRDNPDGVIDDDAQTLIFPTYWPGLILVPMKDVENNHWILAVIHCQKGCASVWDSVSGRYRTRVRTHILSELLKKLDVLLHTTMGSARVGGPIFSLFSVVPSGQVPQQENGHDCGVFVMKFMEWIVDGESPPKSYKVEDAARLDIAIDILTCESNRL
ncbi:uncharacterized protein LOC133820923 isoform X2 [Humulus lupulus]|uniref:uncharacterized protein LOC133820923 isoform X2 n=1 Tax=Humulus lupulus TaxID=3486 RepID=UPI002B416CAF|nr:uncharacterized protein LOC133820923 isoform X2 [Humulus lupulus]